MAIVALIVFGATAAVSLWALWATIAPQRARIIDLLLNGPVATIDQPDAARVRSTTRDVRVRRVVRPAPRCAAA